MVECTWTTARSPIHSGQLAISDTRQILLELTSGLEDLTRALSSIGKRERHNLVEPRELDLIRRNCRQLSSSWKLSASCKIPYILKNDKRSVDAADGVVPNARHDRVGRRLAGVAHDCDGR